jgi:hypothetical protein
MFGSRRGRRNQWPCRSPLPRVGVGCTAHTELPAANSDKQTPDALQTLMRHKSYATTQRYINLASQLDEAVDSLHVPEVLKRERG